MTMFQPGSFIIIPVGLRSPGSPSMDERIGPEVVKSIVDFITRVAPPKGDVIVSFKEHAPLLADSLYYEKIFERLRDSFKRRLHLRLHNNLWTLDDRMIALIRQYEIAVSVDIETDSQICDAQRGNGYYSRTRSAMNRLMANGIPAEEICTLTPCFADAAGQIFGSFGDSPVAAKPYRIQGAVLMPNHQEPGPALNTSEMTAVLTDTLMKYGSDIARRRVVNLDEMARGCLIRKGVACTFSDCIGHVAAIAPDGRVYPCDYFCGSGEFSFGSIFDGLDAAQVMSSAAYQMLHIAHEAAYAACGSCTHFDCCRGGCLANALAAGADKDPYCDAYHTVFAILSMGIKWEQKALDTGRIMEKDAPLLAMAGAVPHPYDLMCGEINMRLALRHARPERGGYLATQKGREYPENTYQNIFLRVTLCGLTERDVPDGDVSEMSVGEAVITAREGAATRFRNVAVTGGEPLLYSHLDNMLDELALLDMTGTRLTLHTTLGINIPVAYLDKICSVFDAIVVNVDEDWTDAGGRGGGRYGIMAKHLKRIRALGCIDKVSLHAAFPEAMKNGFEGERVLQYYRKLGIRDIRFAPPLPAETKGTPPSSFALCMEENEADNAFKPRFTCGLGLNLSVEPDGSVYPCCACRSTKHRLESVQHGLPAILSSEAFHEYIFHDVDSNQKCRECGVRYLCGGICRAWVKEGTDIDSGDFNCSERKAYYEHMAAMIEM